MPPIVIRRPISPAGDHGRPPTGARPEIDRALQDPSAGAARPARVLRELRVENLLLIERAELRLGPGSERPHRRDRRRQDGARPRARPAARRTRAVGDRAPGSRRGVRRGRLRPARAPPPELGERLPAGRHRGGARPPRGLGRAHARLPERPHGHGRRAARPRRRRSSSFYGQHEHRKLTLAAAQLQILDGLCGPDQRAAPARLRRGLRRDRPSAARARRAARSSPARASASSTCSSTSSRRSTPPPWRRTSTRSCSAPASACAASTRSAAAAGAGAEALAAESSELPAAAQLLGGAPPRAWTRSPGSIRAWTCSPSACARC